MTKFFSHKFKVSPKDMEYNICGIKREMKMMRLHKYLLSRFSSFLLNKYVVHDF